MLLKCSLFRVSYFFHTYRPRRLEPFFLRALITRLEVIQSPPHVRNISYICRMTAEPFFLPSEVKHFSRTSAGQLDDPGLEEKLL